MDSEEPQTPPTEGQTVPPEEQILPSGGGEMPAPEAQTVPSEGQMREDEQTQTGPESSTTGETRPGPASQIPSLAQENPMPLAIAGAFLAGVVVGRIFSR